MTMTTLPYLAMRAAKQLAEVDGEVLTRDKYYVLLAALRGRLNPPPECGATEAKDGE